MELRHFFVLVIFEISFTKGQNDISEHLDLHSLHCLIFKNMLFICQYLCPEYPSSSSFAGQLSVIPCGDLLSNHFFTKTFQSSISVLHMLHVPLVTPHFTKTNYLDGEFSKAMLLTFKSLVLIHYISLNYLFIHLIIHIMFFKSLPYASNLLDSKDPYFLQAFILVG